MLNDLIKKLKSYALVGSLALSTAFFPGKANAQESFFDESKLRFYSDTSLDPEVRGDQILRLESKGLDLGVEYNDAGKVKAFGSNLKLGGLNFRTIAEKNEEFTNYELKLRRKFIKGLTAAAGFGEVNGQDLILLGFNYKNLGNPDFDWGADGGYIKLKGDDRVVGDVWINLKKMLGVRDVFFGARYDELDQLFLVASLPSDDEWALRFFRKNNFSKGNQSELNRLVFSTKARPTFIDDSYSYFLVDIDAFRNTNTYIKNPLRYIVPAFHHMGQGSDDGLEAVVVTELLKTPKGDRILKGEFDTYLIKGFWLGINGIYNLESDEKIISIPFGFYYKIGNLRIEPLYNLKEKRFSGLVVVDLDYKF
ncbi:MAG: hypothetical protein ISS25_04350 [Nanoarchaeota archaeon]|nr:hypothetical protein [DPANN group archaeon]MBL7117032.1 hypothetical protein [Nanoarchaeota archaeon]